jgi:hypothetical protein
MRAQARFINLMTFSSGLQNAVAVITNAGQASPGQYGILGVNSGPSGSMSFAATPGNLGTTTAFFTDPWVAGANYPRSSMPWTLKDAQTYTYVSLGVPATAGSPPVQGANANSATRACDIAPASLVALTQQVANPPTFRT